MTEDGPRVAELRSQEEPRAERLMEVSVEVRNHIEETVPCDPGGLIGPFLVNFL
jgi:hypothetical protein